MNVLTLVDYFSKVMPVNGRRLHVALKYITEPSFYLVILNDKK